MDDLASVRMLTEITIMYVNLFCKCSKITDLEHCIDLQKTECSLFSKIIVKSSHR